jgi:signal peptidase II
LNAASSPATFAPMKPLTGGVPLRANQKMALVALVVLCLDQLSKLAVLNFLGYADERVIIDGFFRLVHWGNTGAAWSMFRDRNTLLAGISLVAVVVLFLTRHHFDIHTSVGQVALGLIFGGIIGNLIDRLVHGHVVDFLYFYVNRRGGTELGFPAFNIADSAICTGVGLMFLLSLRPEQPRSAPAEPSLDSGQPS